MDNGSYVFLGWFCLNCEMVGSVLLNTDIVAGSGCVCDLFVEKVGCCRRVLLVPECHVDSIFRRTDRDVDVPVS